MNRKNISAGAAKLYSKNLPEKLEATDIFRKFAEDLATLGKIES